MKQIEIILLLSVLCTMGSAANWSQQPSNKVFWGTSCKPEFSAYATYLDSTSGTVYSNIMNSLMCPYWYVNQPSRSVCEKKYGLETSDPSVQKFYKDCVVPINDYYQGTCEKKSSCGDQSDKCSTCTLGTNCNSWNQPGSKFATSFIVATSPIACTTMTTNCPTSLTVTNLESCQGYYQDLCARTWFKENPTDPCSDLVMCQLQLTSGSVTIVASIITLLILSVL